MRLFKEKSRGKSREKGDNKNAAFKNVKEAHPSKKKKNKKPQQIANTNVILHAKQRGSLIYESKCGSTYFIDVTSKTEGCPNVLGVFCCYYHY